MSEPCSATDIATRHHKLRELAEHTDPDDVQAVLNLGAGVVLHGQLEPHCLQPVLQLVAREVRQELEAEHRRLDEDLELLAELAESEPGGEDVALLAEALLARLRNHLRRDESTLYRPLARILAARSEDI